MKVSLGVAAALAGLSTALQPQPADVYLVHKSGQSSSSESPSVSRQLARLVLLQRLAPETSFGSLTDVPDDVSDETAVAYLSRFAQAPQPLFENIDASANPSQLLLLIEGVTPENMEAAKFGFEGQDPAFRVTDAPSAKANRQLIQQDLLPAGVTRSECGLERAINPLDADCFSGKSSVASYDLKNRNHANALVSLADNLPRLQKLADAGEMETTIVLLGETTRSSTLNTWASGPATRRRQLAEEVMSEAAEAAAESDADDTATSPAGPFVVSGVRDKDIPACFTSKDSCENATNSCSGHGGCEDRWNGKDESKGCFVCRCKGTKTESGSVTHWGGATCSKIDVSVPFWLFAGFTIGMLGIVSFALTMLYSVGSETLPGVIGAGVSKSK